MKIVTNDLAELGEALRLREKIEAGGMAPTFKPERKPYKGSPKLNHKPVAAATSNDGVVWVDEASQITEEQYAELSKRPKPLGVWINHGSGSDWPADILKDQKGGIENGLR